MDYQVYNRIDHFQKAKTKIFYLTSIKKRCVLITIPETDIVFLEVCSSVSGKLFCVTSILKISIMYLFCSYVLFNNAKQTIVNKINKGK